ncbi:MAG: OB-fold nucleic acid binding domain-containing protein [Candidatus Aenigmarchaeota archaeon]|nr:OB-fold nucleic acid binding domain-containing protein [Candidatus Aenigmarchaeota archaeon]
MENKLLIYLSLASSVIGLTIIYIASQNVELNLTSIGMVTYDDVGKNVRVCGRIDSIFTSRQNHVFFKLEDHSGEIDAVVFNSSTNKLQVQDLKKGDLVCVSGRIDEYEDKLEILPQKIERE